MVRFFDNTEKRKRRESKTNEVIEFMQYIFGDYFRVDSNLIFGTVSIYEERDVIFRLFTQRDVGILRRKKYKNLFEKFGRIYEKKFGIKNLEIETDYYYP